MAAFFALLTLLVLFAALPAFVPALYLLLSLATFVVYKIDKDAARRGTWRTAESTLHLMALLGGWPGALIAQQTLRHKSRKVRFRLVYWLTVTVNSGMLIWLTTTAGGTRALDLINGLI